VPGIDFNDLGEVKELNFIMKKELGSLILLLRSSNAMCDKVSDPKCAVEWCINLYGTPVHDVWNVEARANENAISWDSLGLYLFVTILFSIIDPFLVF